MEEYGAMLGPCLKRVLKAEDQFMVAVYRGERKVGPNLLYLVIPNPTGPPQVDGEKVT